MLLLRGVPKEDIQVFPGEHDTTYDEACSLAEFLRRQGPVRVLVVTSDFHMRRARWILGHVLGPRMGQVSMVSAPTDDFSSACWWRSDKGCMAIGGENLKLLFYVLRYSPWPWVFLVAAIAALIALRAWRRRGKSKASPAGVSAPAQAG